MRRFIVFVLVVATLAIGLSAGTVFWLSGLPLPPVDVGQQARMLAKNGEDLATLAGGIRNERVELEDVSPWLLKATVAIEDRRFYEHVGFDWRGIGRAVWINVRNWQKDQGASTITQQLARNMYLSHEKTWGRKWQEALYTLRLERQWDKRKILDAYLNRIYYGHAAYGVRAAARTFFAKEPGELTLAESAMLAGIPNGPKYFSPLLNAERAKQRQRHVLRAMEEVGFISAQTARAAVAEQLRYARAEREDTDEAPYFADYVRGQGWTETGLAREASSSRGLTVETTLDLTMQRHADRTIAKYLKEHDNVQVALIALDPRTGAIRAMSGGRDYRKSQFNRVLSDRRQPGSAFKPIVYMSALLHGATAISKQRSEPTVFQYDGGKQSYAPKNFGGQYALGDIDMRRAIARSDNIYAVKTLLASGPENVVALARKLGVRTPLQPLPSLALGAYPLRPLELAGAYATFAAAGQYRTPHAIARVLDARGRVLFAHEDRPQQVVPAAHAFVLTKLLEGVFAEGGTAHRVAGMLKRPAAGKTGTTNTDAWMVGYTPELVTAVWVGHDRGQPIRTAEAYLAAPIFAEFTEGALAHVAPHMFAIPDDAVSVYVDEVSGKLADSGCPKQRLEHFVRGTEPAGSCTPRKPLPTETEIDRNWFEQLHRWFGN